MVDSRDDVVTSHGARTGRKKLSDDLLTLRELELKARDDGMQVLLLQHRFLPPTTLPSKCRVTHFEAFHLCFKREELAQRRRQPLNFRKRARGKLLLQRPCASPVQLNLAR